MNDAEDRRDRRYNDRQVERILARTVEIAREISRERARSDREGMGNEGGGMSLAELERAALEAGLPPEALRKAEEELEGGPARAGGKAARFFGTAPIVARRRLSPAPSEAELTRLARDLPDIADVPGSGAVAEGGLVYRSDGGYEAQTGQRLRLEIEREGEGAWLRAERRFSQAAGGVYGGVVGGLGLGGGLGVGLGVGLGDLHSGLFAAVFCCSSLVLSFLVSRGIMAILSADAKRRNARLVEAVEKRLAR
jgi:hypothetical protein